MSRSGYHTDFDNPLVLGRWRAQVASATRGKRGQAFFTALLDALDAMPVKELIADELQTDDGAVCAIGALGVARGVNLRQLDPEDPTGIAVEFDIAHQLAREVVYENDENWPSCTETPAERWQRMRDWVAGQIVKP